jgi:hypothetical protein
VAGTRIVEAGEEKRRPANPRGNTGSAARARCTSALSLVLWGANIWGSVV